MSRKVCRLAQNAVLCLAIGLCPAICTAGEDAPVPGASSKPRASNQSEKAASRCLALSGLNNVVIENLQIGPCETNGVEIVDSHNVTIRNLTIKGTSGTAIYVRGSSSIVIEGNRIADAIGGIYALRSSNIQVRCNTITNVKGPVPRGQFVQFDKVSGNGNSVSCNVGRNEPGRSNPEDGISLYQSNGEAGSPIVVRDNLLVGGGPSRSGGGIMLGDNGGSYQIAERNILVDPGQYGIAVSSGSHMSIIDNSVFGRQQGFTNVGIYVWNQYRSECSSITVKGNKVRWFKMSGEPNSFWDGGNCGKIAGLETNDFAADLSGEIAGTKSECKCSLAGRR